MGVRWARPAPHQMTLFDAVFWLDQTQCIRQRTHQARRIMDRPGAMSVHSASPNMGDNPTADLKFNVLTTNHNHPLIL